MHRKWLTIFLIFLVILFAISIIVLLIIVKTNTSSTSFTNLLNTSQYQLSNASNSRGWKQEGSNINLYQFPAIVLEAVRFENDVYKLKISPFNSLTEKFDLHLGLENSKIPFGTCMFNEQGEITGTANWTNQAVTNIINELAVGDNILIRLTYPTDPIGDQIEYTTQLKKQIDLIENKENLNNLFPSSVCKQI